MTDDNSNNKVKLDIRELDSKDKALVDKSVNGGYSRREVMKLMVATGVTMAAAEQILYSGSVAHAATPKKGGSAVIAMDQHGPSDTLDPNLFTASIDYSRGRATYNGLTQYGDNGALLPDLAESWEPNSNASEWTFKIRKGVVFHDGSKMTIDDVLYSMNRHIAEDSTSVVKAVFSSIKEWRKSGPNEVKAIMTTPNADLPVMLGSYQLKIIKSGSKGGGVGTGPYTVESFEPGIRSVHKRNENYWREGGNLDSFQITAITDSVARVNAVITGDVDLAATIDPKAFRQIDSADGVSLNSLPSASQLGICIMSNAAPGNNRDFVKAVQFAQDRERVVKRILKGKGSVGNDQPVMAGHGADFCSELPQREFDLDKAKFHFKKSGVTSAELYVAPVATGIEDICLLTQANCAKAGFDLKLKKVPSDGYWGAVWLKEPMNVVGWNMRATANFQMSVQFAPGAPWNDTAFDNARMGELLTKSLAEVDPDKRHAMYCEMQTLIHNESGIVIPAFGNETDAIRDNFHGMPKVALGPMGGNEWPEFIWKS